MRADYDSEGDTIQIELESVGRLDYGEDVQDGAVIVGILGGTGRHGRRDRHSLRLRRPCARRPKLTNSTRRR